MSVFSGTKWAANVWIWNAARPVSTAQEAIGKKAQGSSVHGMQMNVQNDTGEPLALLGTRIHEFLATIPSGESTTLNTFIGHEWIAKDAGGVLQKFKADKSALVCASTKIYTIKSFAMAARP